MKPTPFRFLRFAFVIASFSPLFILLGIKGNKHLSDLALWSSVIFLVFLPNGLLYLRWWLIRKSDQVIELQIMDSTDNRDSLVIYLLAVLLALYGVNPESVREWVAYALTVLFVIILFWMTNLHHLNVLFNILGYKTYTITIKVNGSNGVKSMKAVLLTKSQQPSINRSISCYRLSHDIFIEQNTYEI